MVMFNSLCYVLGFFGDVSVDMTVCAQKQIPLPTLRQPHGSYKRMHLIHLLTPSFPALQHLMLESFQGGSRSTDCHVQMWPIQKTDGIDL